MTTLDKKENYLTRLFGWMNMANPVHVTRTKRQIANIEKELNKENLPKEKKLKLIKQKYACVNKGLETTYKNAGVKDYLEHSTIPKLFRFGGFCIVNMGVAYVLLKNPIIPFMPFASVIIFLKF